MFLWGILLLFVGAWESWGLMKIGKLFCGKMDFTMALVPHQDCDSCSLPSKDGCFHDDEVYWTPNAGDNISKS